MAKSREHDLHYLNQEYSAMRWLAKQGLTPEEIREFTWGRVDESEKVVKIRRVIFSIRYDRGTGHIFQQEHKKEVKISFKGSGHEWFFTKSPMYNVTWMFTAHRPKSWRKEQGREALFPLEAVKNCCRDIAEIPSTNLLTLAVGYGNIEVSKLNIQNLKTVEQIEEAEIKTEA
jgi:hypothetical protein